jgi:hypothetical protein
LRVTLWIGGFGSVAPEGLDALAPTVTVPLVGNGLGLPPQFGLPIDSYYRNDLPHSTVPRDSL